MSVDLSNDNLMDLSGTDNLDQNDKFILLHVEYGLVPFVPHYFIATLKEEDSASDVEPLNADIKIDFGLGFMMENARTSKTLKLKVEHDDIMPATFYEVYFLNLNF